MEMLFQEVIVDLDYKEATPIFRTFRILAKLDRDIEAYCVLLNDVDELARLITETSQGHILAFNTIFTSISRELKELRDGVAPACSEVNRRLLMDELDARRDALQFVTRAKGKLIVKRLKTLRRKIASTSPSIADIYMERSYNQLVTILRFRYNTMRKENFSWRPTNHSQVRTS
ncbi:Hypothetical Protein FCC1311_112852 [Hondaea fermentalgiana]|uniref:Uncharacterized protein n=1 Tax=Hondaea fermentalgiana TaxID=2315210 RepID=A0A2R5GW47_9STRA|nr:Hypothetical Protein FCC1311_112852 [Hondaea fermentalgiana]|eukprot:GBG35062.1 Hypothetical Protein FCC1311_112852 [Hondaea fermentalgiana]